MANSCYFCCKLKGSEGSVRKAAGMFLSSSIGRISAFRVLEEYFENGSYCVEGDGECAWSINAALVTAKTNVLDLTMKYGLIFEGYSEETGFGFQEHYIIKNGTVETEESIDYREECLADLSKKEIEDLAAEEKITVAALEGAAEENDGYYKVGGFPDWEFTV